MDYDKDKVDEMTLALMCLVMFGDQFGTRAWKHLGIAGEGDSEPA